MKSEEFEEFDVLVFAGRKIKSCSIPQKKKKISSYAFADSSITNIKISHHITQICEGSFYFCKQLKNIEIPLNSHLQVINESAFLECAISSIYIPLKVTYLGKNSPNCGNLKIVEFDENAELRAIESRKMSYCKQLIIMIPIKLRNHFKVI